MGWCVAISKCKNRQRKSCINETNCKYFEGGYGRLPLGDVYTCYGFLQIMCKFEEADSRTFFLKLIQQFVDGWFGNLWQLDINRIYETSKTTLCNSR